MVTMHHSIRNENIGNSTPPAQLSMRSLSTYRTQLKEEASNLNSHLHLLQAIRTQGIVSEGGEFKVHVLEPIAAEWAIA